MKNVPLTKLPSVVLVATCLTLAHAGCDTSAIEPQGQAYLAVSGESLGAANISRLVAEVTDVRGTVSTHELQQANGTWKTVVERLKPGTTEFVVSAADRSGATLYRGSATAEIIAGATAPVLVVIHPLTQPEAFGKIEAVVADRRTVVPGGQINVSVKASDPAPGHVLSYRWEASAGSFAQPDQPSTVWSAPPRAGEVRITVTVTDRQQAVQSLLLTVEVLEPEAPTGAAEVDVKVNQPPTVGRLEVAPSYVTAGATLTISADVFDDEILAAAAFAWTSDCAGGFGASGASPAGEASASWRVAWVAPPELVGRLQCAFELVVTDEHGASQKGRLVVPVRQPEVAPDAGCPQPPCQRPAWFGLGGSDSGPWTSTPQWGSDGGGGISKTEGDSWKPKVALDRAGNPYVVWREDLPTDTVFANGEIYVRRFDGSRWTEVGEGSAVGGGISQTTTTSSDPAIALDLQDHPIVAWADDGIFVKRFDGTRWTEIGVGSASRGISDGAGDKPALAVDDGGQPVVAWPVGGPGGAIVVKRYDGRNWVRVGSQVSRAGPADDAPAGSVALALDRNDRPVLAWRQGGCDWCPSANIYVKRFDGDRWVEVGGSATAGGISGSAIASGHPSLVLDDAGHPIVSWTERLGQSHFVTYIKRYDGQAWVEVSSGSARGEGLGNGEVDSLDGADLVRDAAGRLTLVWTRQAPGFGEDWGIKHVYISRFESGRWQAVGPASTTGSGLSGNRSWVSSPHVALAEDGAPTVVWVDAGSGNRQIYARRFDGRAWQGIGASAPSTGISNDLGSSVNPTLAVDADGRPIVAWIDRRVLSPRERQERLYVRRFDGQRWVELGQGSAAGAGVAGLGVRNPVLAHAPSGDPWLLWTEWPEGVFLRRFDGEQWVAPDGLSTDGRLSASSASATALRFDARQQPLAAWVEYIRSERGSHKITIHGAGDSWAATGGYIVDRFIAGGGFDSRAMALDEGGQAVTAWSETLDHGPAEIMVKGYGPAGPRDLGPGAAGAGGISRDEGRSTNATLCLDRDGLPIVAWENFKDDSYTVSQIYVRRFDGEAWRELGAGSASGGGVSGTSARSKSPAIALDANGNPLIAWNEWDGPTGVPQIYARAFDGRRWVEVGEGSASGGGISKTRIKASAPAIAAGGGRVCVAWSEYGHASEDIVLRCTDR